MNKFPELSGPRVMLRNFRTSDVAALYKIFSDDQVTEFYDIHSFSRMEQAEKLVNFRIRLNETRTGGAIRWAVCLASNPDAMIGSTGFHSANPESAAIEVGYEMDSACWGQGLAAEAVGIALNFCFSEYMPFKINRVAATTDLESKRSIALLRRLGFAEEGILRDYGYWKDTFHTVRLFSLLRREWAGEKWPWHFKP